MKANIVIIGTLLVPALISGCSGINRNLSNLLFPPYANSDQRQGENTIVSLEEPLGNYPQSCRPEFEPAFIPPQAAAAAVEFAVKQVQKFLQEEAKRYTASYSATAVGQHFYKACSADIALSSISIKRLTKRYNDPTNPAMEMVLKVEAVDDQTAFQINPEKVSLHQSKAKVAVVDITRPLGFDLLAPWTIFHTFSESGDISGFSPIRPAQVDMKAEIMLHGVWIDKDQKGHAELLASRSLSIPRVGIGECRLFSGSSNVVCSENGGFTEVTKAGYLSYLKKELFPAIPRSVKVDQENPTKVKSLGYGNYIVSVLVTEVDNFGERVNEIGNAVKDNESSITDMINRALE